MADVKRLPPTAMQHFWSPDIDPAHPMDCTQPERYVLRRLSNGSYIAIDGGDQSLIEVQLPEEAYGFHTHEAALRAAGELNRLGTDTVDVVKFE
jgi:hypothetical protein